MENGVETLAAIHGATRAGVIAVPVNARYKARELEYVLEHCDVRAVLSLAALRAAARRGGGRAPRRALRRHVERPARGRGARHDLAARGRRDAALHVGHDLAPEGLPAHAPRARRTPAATSACTASPPVAGDRMWDPLPLFHLATLLPFNGCLVTGCAFVGCERFDAEGRARRARHLHGRVRRLRPDLGRGARAPRLRVHRPLEPAPGQRQRRPRAPAADGGQDAVADPDHALRRDRGRRRDRAQPPRRPARDAADDRGPAVRRLRGQDRRSRHARGAPARRARRDRLPRPGHVRGLLPRPRADRGRRRRARLLPLRRPRQHGRRRPPQLPRPHQGHAQGRRRERRRGRDRGLPGRAPGDLRGPGRRRARPPLRRGPVRVRHAAPGRAS